MTTNENNRHSAIVTGSSRGIGRAIALQLASEAYAVVVNYLRNRDAATEVVERVRSAGGVAVAVAADVGRSDGRRALLDAAGELGPLRVLVNNAGITSQGRRDLLEATEESWDAVFSTNLKGPFFLAQAAAKQMIEAMGEGQIADARIINVSSISA